MKSRFKDFGGRDYVALLLAFALFVAVTGATVSIIYATIVNERRTVTDATTQLLTALFGGIVGILGAYVGMTKDSKKKKEEEGSGHEQDTSTH